MPLQPCMLHLCSVSMLFAQCGIAFVALAEAGVRAMPSSSDHLACAGSTEHSIQGHSSEQAHQGQLLTTWSAPGPADC